MYKIKIVLLSILLYTDVFSSPAQAGLTLVGSTPCDPYVKSILSIPAASLVDFMNWDIQFINENSYTLHIIYGESKPNTLGFINGGTPLSFKGVYSRSHLKNEIEIFQLHLNTKDHVISIATLNDNVFHLLDADNSFIVGNGGWSYALNRKSPIKNNHILLTSLFDDQKADQLIFEGRTPCQDIANEHQEMKVSNSCFKLKWRLTLYKDSVSHLPSQYMIRKVVNNKPQEVSGRWTLIKGTKENPEAILIKLVAANDAESIILQALDNNVLYFLSADGTPYIGNENFSYTLNKRS